MRRLDVRVPTLVLIGLVSLAAPPAAAQAPESFRATARVKTATGLITAPVEIQLQRYTPDFDRKAVESALEHGGYANFLNALRKAPEVGSVSAGDSTFSIRWAREQKTAKGRTIVVVTDKPVFFVGGGRANAKPRAGYEVALIELMVDGAGRGTGTMSGAARVKPGGEAGVRIDNYADEPITLLEVTRKAP